METLIYLLKSSAILAIFYSFYLIFLQKETFYKLNRHFLLIGIFSAVIVPILVFKKEIFIDAEAINSNLN
ncbi:MAG: hypothetical protein V7767_14465, partial [Leeuwenhoekiella sp.]